jgi:AAA15 family ATPase/GTPase
MAMSRIHNLHIENFRVISRLDYAPHQVNIICGRNNTGKSALLDAILINTQGCIIRKPSINRLFGIELDRDTTTYTIKNGENKAIINSDMNKVTIYRSLTDCKNNDPKRYEIVQEALYHRIFDTVEGDEEYKEKYISIIFDTIDYVITISEEKYEIIPYLSVDSTRFTTLMAELDRSSGTINEDDQRSSLLKARRLRKTLSSFRFRIKESNPEDDKPITPVNKLSHEEKLSLGKMTDEDIHHLEKYIKDQNLVKNLERLTQENVLYNKDNGIETIPISSHGDGFIALLSTLHHLIRSRNGILLIEEPENHLHPRYLGVLIETLFSYCEELNVQVFMTTHSFDLIKMALEYPENVKEKEMLLISKMTTDGTTVEKFDYTVDEGLRVIDE